MKNRIKSFTWRTAMMTIAFLVTAIDDNLFMLELNTTLTVVLGLILGELSKYLNNTKK